MADGEYRRLTCTVEACDGEHKAHGYCLRHYRQWQRGGVRQDATHCAHCQRGFNPAHVGTIYCSKRCKHAAWVKANHERYQTLPSVQAKVCAVYAGFCIQCGAAYVAKRKRKYCGQACKSRAAHVPSSPLQRPCKCCGNLFTPPHGKPRLLTCSEACRRSAVLRRKKTAKVTRAARLRGARRTQHVDPIKVFERDRWHCKLCGVPTPPSKRGTYEDDAPELDHIVPVARGGDHTYSNTRCACRRCNQAKSDRLIYLPPRRRRARC